MRAWPIICADTALPCGAGCHTRTHPLRAGGRGGLGADLDNPALLAKQAQAARAKEYAKRAQQRTAVLGDVSHGIGNRDAMASQQQVRVRFHIIGNTRIKNVGKYQSCMFSKLPIIWKQTVYIDRERDRRMCT